MLKNYFEIKIVFCSMHKYELYTDLYSTNFSDLKFIVGYKIALLVHHLFSEHIKLQINTHI